MHDRNIRIILIPLAALVLFVLLTLTGAFSWIDSRIFDLLLRLRPPVEQHQDILLVDFDDPAIDAAGTWPVSREVFADGLLLMKEMESTYAVFDIEFVDRSPRGVNSEVLERDIPETFEEELGNLSRNIGDLFGAISSGLVDPSDSKEYVEDLVTLTEEVKGSLLSKISSISKDNDEYLGKAARFFNRAYLTVHFEHEPDASIPEELKRFVTGTMGLTKLDATGGEPPVVEEIRPAIFPVLKGAAGVGFTNADPDEDGVRRRLDLVVRYGDTYLSQLGFSALLHWLGDPRIEYAKRSITLRGAHLPGEEP